LHGTFLPDYELLRSIGHGAYGEVWLARTPLGSRRKIVRRDRHATPESFEREFKGLQKFEPVSRTHEGVVDILTLGLLPEGTGFYYVMELADAVGEVQSSKFKVQSFPASLPVTGALESTLNSSAYVPHTLRQDLEEQGRLPAARVVELGIALTEALGHLHAHGLVHRDVKPSNIIFVNGRPKLADIGLVTDAGDAQSIVGTEGYLAPEGPGAPAGDIFALGKVLTKPPPVGPPPPRNSRPTSGNGRTQAHLRTQ
jgi:serine/threonine protein kinase